MGGPAEPPLLADEAGWASVRADSSPRSASDYGSVREGAPLAGEAAGSVMANKLASRGMREFKSSPIANIALFILMPWVIFIVVMAPFALGYRHCATLAWIIFAAAALLSAGVFVAGKDREATKAQATLLLYKYWRYLGYLCMVSTLLGMGLGFYVFFKHTVVYHTYEASRFYLNVLPSQAPVEFMDAGMFTFSQDTAVDPTRSVGYSVLHRYCAAPIFNRAMAARSPTKGTLPKVNFWAVGLDCCRAKGHFECGPVWDGTAHSALRVLDASPFQGEETQNFRKAVREAAALYGLAAPENAILVKWTSAPQGLPQAYWEDAVHFYKKAVGIYVAAMLAVALFGALYWDSRRVSAPPPQP